MKGIIALAALLSVATLIALSQTITPGSERAEAEIRRLDDAEREALLRGDAEVLESIWSDDLMVNNPLNQISNKRQVLERVRAGQLRYRTFAREIELLRIYANVALVMGSETVVPTGERAGAEQTIRRRYSAIWMRQEGRWRMIARHANIIAPQ